MATIINNKHWATQVHEVRIGFQAVFEIFLNLARAPLLYILLNDNPAMTLVIRHGHIYSTWMGFVPIAKHSHQLTTSHRDVGLTMCMWIILFNGIRRTAFETGCCLILSITAYILPWSNVACTLFPIFIKPLTSMFHRWLKMASITTTLAFTRTSRRIVTMNPYRVHPKRRLRLITVVAISSLTGLRLKNASPPFLSLHYIKTIFFLMLEKTVINIHINMDFVFLDIA